MRPSLLTDIRNDEWSCFLVRKSYTGSNDQKGGNIFMDEICAVGHGEIHMGPTQSCMNVGIPAFETK